jgi:hypothetical protein
MKRPRLLVALVSLALIVLGLGASARYTENSTPAEERRLPFRYDGERHVFHRKRRRASIRCTARQGFATHDFALCPRPTRLQRRPSAPIIGDFTTNAAGVSSPRSTRSSMRPRPSAARSVRT